MRAGLLALAFVACSSAAPSSAPAPTTPGSAAPAPATVGRVVKTKFESRSLGVKKDVVIYLPAGYDEQPDKHWPVIYYLHGLLGNETNWIEGGHLDETANALRLGAIIVMPDGDDGFYSDWANPIDYEACTTKGVGLFTPERSPGDTCVKTAAYERYITADLVVWVDSEYRTLGTRESRGIAGLSMGGFGALMLALRHPGLFGAAASHSGITSLLYGGPIPYERSKVVLMPDPAAIWADRLGHIGVWVRNILGTDRASWVGHDPASLIENLEPGKLALYLDCGTEDEFRLQYGMQYVHDLLTERGIEHTYYLGAGHHDFKFWEPRSRESLAFFQAKLTPAK